MITWPAVIKYAEDDELIYIFDFEEWKLDTDLHLFEYEQLDILIDYLGNIHHLNNRDKYSVVPEPTGEVIDLQCAVSIVQAHFSSIGACCAAKLSMKTVAELVDLIGIER